MSAPVAEEVVLVSADVEAVPWRAFRHDPRVQERLLWREARTGSTAGLLRLSPGAAVEPHRHPYAVHHGWVVEGSCEVDGNTLSEGSYWFVPAARSHGIARAGPAGCTVFYLYLNAEMDD